MVVKTRGVSANNFAGRRQLRYQGTASSAVMLTRCAATVTTVWPRGRARQIHQQPAHRRAQLLPGQHCRAGLARRIAIGLFGGKSHVIKDNLIVNNFSGAGIRPEHRVRRSQLISRTAAFRSRTTSSCAPAPRTTSTETRAALDFQEVKGRRSLASPSPDNLIVRPYAEEIRAELWPHPLAASRCATTSATTRPWPQRRPDR